MKILVIGLCLSRNLGGPAMASVLMRRWKQEFPGTTFSFAVNPGEMASERVMGDLWGVGVVPRSTFPDLFFSLLPPVLWNIPGLFLERISRVVLKGISSRLRSGNHLELMAAVRSHDLVLNMSGISYVGDGTRGPHTGLWDYFPRFLANRLGKPYLGFVQSYGPFNDCRVRLFARRELEQLPVVFARGRNSAGFCRKLVSCPEKIWDVPDIAINLSPASLADCEKIIEKYELCKKQVTVVCPSAVMAAMSVPGKSLGCGHLESIRLIVSGLLATGRNVLFLPHMYSKKTLECDRQVAMQILKQLGSFSNDRVNVVEEDLSASQAKTIISLAELTIVSRYHALVASLSASVPSIAIGWNEKYADLLRYYQSEETTLDARCHSPARLSNDVLALVSRLTAERGERRDCLRRLQLPNERKVENAFGELFRLVRNHVPNTH